MRNHTPLMKTVRLWNLHTSELRGLAADGSLDLLALSAAELADLRSQAERLVHALDAWCSTHRPMPATQAVSVPSQRT